MDLSVVIVNWNAEMDLRRCLASLPEATGGLRHEALVVDNASTDGSLAMIERHFERVEVIRLPSNRGFGRGAQEGIARAQGSFIAVLNADVTLAPGSLLELVSFLRKHPRAGLAGPGIRLENRTLQSEARPLPGVGSALRFVPLLGRLQPPRERYQPSAPTRCGWVRGPCLVFRARALGEIGGFPMETFMYGEELLLGHRLAEAGWEVWYVPSSEVLHIHARSSRQRWDEARLQVAVWTGRTFAMRELLGRGRFGIWCSLVSLALALQGALGLLRIRPATLPILSLLRLQLRALLTDRIPPPPEPKRTS